MSTVRTRFAPSPTGFIHLGNIRSALYPWAFARANQGKFILRIEDTDLDRSTQASVDVILEGMKWLGLTPDEGPFYQMQRIDRYKENPRWRDHSIWVGLTPDELNEIFDSFKTWNSFQITDVYFAIETKLKDKNGY